MRRRTPTRIGATTLAITIALSGLTLGPAAVAAPAPLDPATDPPTTAETTADTSTRTVGPLAIVVSGSSALGLRSDPDSMRTTGSGTIAQALAGADYWSVPAVGQSGPVRGVGSAANRCLTHSTSYADFQVMNLCSGNATQNWQWTTVPGLQGQVHALTPSRATSWTITSRGDRTYVGLTNATTGRHTMALTGMKAERTLTASACVDLAALDVVVTGTATTGATVSANGVSAVAGDDGGYTLRVGGLGSGDHQLTVTQTLPNGVATGTATVGATIEAPAADATMVAPGVLQLAASGTGSFAALTVRSDTLGYSRFVSHAAAVAAADAMEFPALGATGPIRGTGALRDRCVRYLPQRPDGDNVSMTSCVTSGTDDQWTWIESPTSYGENRYALAPAGSPARALTIKPTQNHLHVRDMASASPFSLSGAVDPSPLSAEAAVDPETGVVTLTGAGTPGSTVSTRDRSDEVAADGRWSLVVDDLPGGPQTLTIVQTLASGVAYDSAEVDVDVPRDHGLVVPVDSPEVSLVRGAEGQVSFHVRSERIQAGYQGAVTLTAPEGTRFPAQETALAEWRSGGSGAFSPSPELLLRSGEVSSDGTTIRFTWPASQVGPDAFRYTVRVVADPDAPAATDAALGYLYTGTSVEGPFRVSGETPVTFRDAYVDATLVSPVDGDTFTPGPVTFTGTGTPGAEITISPVVGAPVSTEVRSDGTWQAIRHLGNGAATFTVTHVADGGRNTIENIRLFSDQAADGPLVVTSPAAGAGHDRPGFVTISGTGTTWSKISISDGTDTPPTTTTVDYDGSWSVRRWIGTELTALTITSTRADEVNGRVERSFNTGSTVREFAVTSHVDGGTFTPGPVVISGEATTGDTVTLTAAGLPALQTKADRNGRWSVDRWLGNGFITFTVTHTPASGDETQRPLRLFSDKGTVGDFVVTTPVDGDRQSSPGWLTFSGTGTSWSTVTISDGRSGPTTTTVQIDGTWSVDRWVGVAPTIFTIGSSRGAIENGSAEIEYNQADTIADFEVTSHTDGGTFTPGQVLFAGTGSTGDRVRLTAAGLPPLETVVDRRGTWSIGRYLGNGAITFSVEHTPATGSTTVRTLRLFSDQAASGPLVVTSPSAGDRHDTAGYVTFSGTGTTWSTVTITDGSNAAPTRVDVGHGGVWSVQRWVGTDPVTLTVTSVRAGIQNGTTEVRYNSAD